MDVIVTNLQSISVDVKFVRDVVVRALRLQGYREPPDVGVALVDDAYIRVLNREYRGGDSATDVLAFGMDDGVDDTVAGRSHVMVAGSGADGRSAGEPGDDGPRASRGGHGGPSGPPLGDIVISVQRAREQARQFKQPLRREVALLAIHGLLHLLGYDDETEAAAAVMWSRQKELLETILGTEPRTQRTARAAPAGRRAAR